ncbi:MAG: SCP2 sterol-binding domain-containing protein [Gammaproteobacteria bacterium]|nr:SCP2 sterol-binding domain-containing protein [Gammaproteobacteria bacterium]
MILQLLQEVGNRLVKLDPDAMRQLGELAGRVVEIELIERGVKLYLIVGEHGIQVSHHWDEAADVKLRGTLIAFTRFIATGMDPRLLSDGEITVEGEMELGQQIARIINRMTIDWEEQISHVVGDIPAHQLGNIARDTKAWVGHARAKFAQDTAEYLQEELRELAPRSRVDTLLSNIDTLRSDVDRLEQRVDRLSGSIE